MITFVATAHFEKDWDMPFIDSMRAQTNKEWKAIIFHNGPNPILRDRITALDDSRFIYEESSIDSGMWGTKNRQMAIAHVVDTPYLVNTSIQDIILPCAVQDITEIIESTGADLITWQAINHLFRYRVLNGELAWGHIDWGQWCIKTDIIRRVGVQQMDNFSADWHTLNTIRQRGLIKIHKSIDRILTIHN